MVLVATITDINSWCCSFWAILCNDAA